MKLKEFGIININKLNRGGIMNIIDCKGLACPMPVIKTKK